MKSRTPIQRKALTLLLVAAVALSATAGFAGAATTTDLTVSITDEDDTIAPDETTTVEIAVANADGGVGGAELGFELSDPGVATITEVETNSAPSLTDNVIAGGGQSADVEYFGVDTADTGSVTFVTVTLQAASAGTTDIEITQNSQTGDLDLYDEDGAGYTIDSVGSATLTVEEPDQNTAPTADAGDDQTVDEGDSVTLDASGSSDPDGDSLSYSWSETTSSGVTLDDDTSAMPSLTAPDVESETTLTFEVEVSDDDLSDTDTVNVTVQPVTDEPDPANFQVSNLNAPDSATQGDNITVSANVTNDGDEEATQAVAFRLDADDNGTLEEDETLASEEVTLDGDESQTVTFSDLDTSDFDADDYTHGVFTDDDSETATITIEESEVSASETSVSLSPESSVVVVNDTETYDVVVDSADAGVGAYEITVSLDDPSVASITDVELGGGPSSETQNVTFAEDGSSVSVRAALANTDDTGNVTIASVTVKGTAEGSSGLSVNVQALGNEDGESYTITEENGASVSVVDIGAVGDYPDPPTDTDGDGLYEDVNGDGTFDIVDIQALFANLDDETVQSNLDAFDFNGDGEVDVVDVQKLFTEYSDQ